MCICFSEDTRCRSTTALFINIHAYIDGGWKRSDRLAQIKYSAQLSNIRIKIEIWKKWEKLFQKKNVWQENTSLYFICHCIWGKEPDYFALCEIRQIKNIAKWTLDFKSQPINWRKYLEPGRKILTSLAPPESLNRNSQNVIFLDILRLQTLFESDV